MATSSPPADPNALMFPAFMYGDHASCRRKMKAEAKKWGAFYQKHGTFPEPKLIPVPPGATIFMGDQSSVALMNMGMKFDMKPQPLGTAPELFVFGERPNQNTPRWYFYLAWEFRSEVMLYYFKHRMSEPPGLDAAYEALACRYPWGALNEAITHALYNTIPTVSRRLETLLSFWDKLDTVRYFDDVRRITTLTGLIKFHFQGHIAMWVDAPTGDIRMNLRTAIEQMRRASDVEIRERLIKRLRALVDTERDLQHRDWLKEPGRIEAALEARLGINPNAYADLTTGRWGTLGGFLFVLEKDYPGT